MSESKPISKIVSEPKQNISVSASDGRTHWDGCWQEHEDCAAYKRLIDAGYSVTVAPAKPLWPKVAAALLPEGVKHDGDKLRYDLIPPRALEELARVYTIGAKKYDDRNWERGLAWCRVFAAMMRHAWRWYRGERYDKEGGQHHLASVAWTAFALMEYEHTHPELDNRPKDLC